jgi:hypothetical protein
MGKPMTIEQALEEVMRKPLVDLWPTTATLYDLSRSGVYDAAKRGEIDTRPCWAQDVQHGLWLACRWTNGPTSRRQTISCAKCSAFALGSAPWLSLICRKVRPRLSAACASPMIL